jgi:hypothetical protein
MLLNPLLPDIRSFLPEAQDDAPPKNAHPQPPEAPPHVARHEVPGKPHGQGMVPEGRPSVPQKVHTPSPLTPTPARLTWDRERAHDAPKPVVRRMWYWSRDGRVRRSAGPYDFLNRKYAY